MVRHLSRLPAVDGIVGRQNRDVELLWFAVVDGDRRSVGRSGDALRTRSGQRVGKLTQHLVRVLVDH
jgi:hypothetical protein